MAAVGDLLDVNVWVALTAPDHAFHYRAVQYWHHEADQTLHFCRITALGLVRVCCRPHSPSGARLTPLEAWDRYTGLCDGQTISLLNDPVGLEQQPDHWVRAGLVTPNSWTDAYLAAFAASGGLRLVTFDADFSRFEGPEILLLG